PSAKHLQLILHTLDRLERKGRDERAGAGKTTLFKPLQKLSENLRRRNDVIVFHLLDPHEIDFSFSDASNFIDLETGEKMPVIPQYLRDKYREIVREHTATLAKRIGETRADYSLFDTSKPLDRALFTYLAARQRLLRVR